MASSNGRLAAAALPAKRADIAVVSAREVIAPAGWSQRESLPQGAPPWPAAASSSAHANASPATPSDCRVSGNGMSNATNSTGLPVVVTWMPASSNAAEKVATPADTVVDDAPAPLAIDQYP